jgi:hypothetical protein
MNKPLPTFPLAIGIIITILLSTPPTTAAEWEHGEDMDALHFETSVLKDSD